MTRRNKVLVICGFVVAVVVAQWLNIVTAPTSIKLSDGSVVMSKPMQDYMVTFENDQEEKIDQMKKEIDYLRKMQNCHTAKYYDPNEPFNKYQKKDTA